MKATLAVASIGALLSSALTSASPVPETAQAAQVEKRCSPFDTTPTYYADGKNITYSSNNGWKILTNQGSRDEHGTEAYSGDACA